MRALTHTHTNSLKYKTIQNISILYATRSLLLVTVTQSPVSQCNHLSFFLFLSFCLPFAYSSFEFYEIYEINTNNLVQMLSPKCQFQPCYMLYNVVLCCAICCTITLHLLMRQHSHNTIHVLYIFSVFFFLSFVRSFNLIAFFGQFFLSIAIISFCSSFVTYSRWYDW